MLWTSWSWPRPACRFDRARRRSICQMSRRPFSTTTNMPNRCSERAAWQLLVATSTTVRLRKPSTLASITTTNTTPTVTATTMST